jgi:hypothetical protein
MMVAAKWLFVILTSFVCFAGNAYAAPPDKKASDKESIDKLRKCSEPRKAPGVTALSELVVVGRIQKPEVFYILSRVDFRYKGLQLKRSFVDKIKKSVRSNPF